jgi:hypothetical protein
VVFLIPRVDFLYCWMSHLSLCFLKGVHKGKFWECLQSTINKHNRNFNHKPDQETCQRQASFLMPQPFFDSCCDVHSRIAIFHSFTFTPINLLPIKPNSSKFYQAYLYEWNLSLRIKQSSIKLTTVNLSIQLTSIKLTAIQLPSVQLACLFSVIYVWQSPYLYPTLLLLLPTKRLNMWGYPVLVLASPVLHCFGLIEKQVLSSYSLHLLYSLNFWGQRHICMDRCLVNWDTYSNLGNKLCQHWTLNYPISWSQDGYWGARGLAG